MLNTYFFSRNAPVMLGNKNRKIPGAIDAESFQISPSPQRGIASKD